MKDKILNFIESDDLNSFYVLTHPIFYLVLFLFFIYVLVDHLFQYLGLKLLWFYLFEIKDLTKMEDPEYRKGYFKKAEIIIKQNKLSCFQIFMHKQLKSKINKRYGDADTTR